MKDTYRNTTSFMYNCINNAAVIRDFDSKISIDNYEVTLKCDYVWASAMMVSAKSLTAAGLLIATIY